MEQHIENTKIWYNTDEQIDQKLLFDSQNFVMKIFFLLYR